MKKNILFILFYFAGISGIHAQCINDIYTGYGGVKDDQGQSIIIDANQNVYISGYFHDTIQLGNIVLTADSIAQFLCKISAGGNVQWAKVLYNCSMTYYAPPLLKLNHSGELLVAGECQEVTGYFDSIANAFANGDLFIARFDTSSGALTSFLSTGRHLYAFINDFDIDSSDNIYLAGIFVGIINFGSISMNCLGQTNSFITKIDAQNQALWAHRITTSPNTTANRPEAIGFDHFNHLYLAGWYGLNADFGNGISLNSPVFLNGFIAKYDLNGNVLWAKSSDTSRTFIFQMIADTGSITIVETNPLTFINYNQDGDTSWTRPVSNSGNPFSEFYFMNGKYYAAGNFYNSITLDGNIYSSPGSNMFISAFYSDGTINWMKLIKSSNGIQCNDMSLNANLDVAVTGAYNPYDTLNQNIVMPWWGFNDVLFIEWCNVAATIGNEIQDTELLNIYPNPARDKIILTSNDNAPISIYNIFGEVQFVNKITHKNQHVELDISFLKTGMYFLLLGNRVIKFIKD